LSGKVQGDATLVDSIGLNIGGMAGSGLSIAGNFSLQAGGNITESAPLSVTGTTIFTFSSPGSNLVLASQANDFQGTVTIVDNGNVQDVSLRNRDAAAIAPILP